MRQNAREESLDPVDHAPEIDAHDPVPIVVSREFHRPSDSYARVVAQHVNLTEDALGLEGRARHRLAVGDVEFYGVNRAAAVERSHRLLQLVAPDVGYHHLHAFVGEHLRHSEADAAGPAGDECNFAFHFFHWSPVPYGIRFLNVKCAHAIKRRGGFSPPNRLENVRGRGKPAPTILGALFFQIPYDMTVSFITSTSTHPTRGRNA